MFHPGRPILALAAILGCSMAWAAPDDAPALRLVPPSLIDISFLRVGPMPAGEVISMIARDVSSEIYFDSTLADVPVSIELHSVSFEEALRAIAQAIGGRLEKRGGVFVIRAGSSADNDLVSVNPSLEASRRPQPAPGTAEPMVARSIPLQHASATEMEALFNPVPPTPEPAAPRIGELLREEINGAFVDEPGAPGPWSAAPEPRVAPLLIARAAPRAREGSRWGAVRASDILLPGMGGPPVAAAEGNALLARGTEEAIGQLREIASQFDQPLKPVRLTLRFVELSQAQADEILGPQPSFGGLAFVRARDLTPKLEALSNAGARVGEPIEATVPNTTPLSVTWGALVRYHVQTQVAATPFPVMAWDPRAEFVGLEILVTPQVNPDDSVSLRIAATTAQTLTPVAPPVGPPPLLASIPLASARVAIRRGESLAVLGYPNPLAEARGAVPGATIYPDAAERPRLMVVVTVAGK